MIRSLGRAGALTVCLASVLLVTPLVAGAAPAPYNGVTADRPGTRAVQAGPVEKGRTPASPRRQLTAGEGAGRGFCKANGGYPLGANLHNVYACGPATGTVDDFSTAGFQCVELVERYLWVNYGDFIPNVPSGKDLVALGHATLGLTLVKPGPGRLPAVGDAVSLWGGSNAQPFGHAAIVSSVSVNGAGNGIIGMIEENGTATGWDHIDVTNWVQTYGDPSWGGGAYYYDHIVWLRMKQPTPPAPVPAIQLSVRGLGPNSVAAGINDSGTVTGSIHHQRTGGGEWTQPFVVSAGSWSYPSAPATSTQIAGINAHGAIAGWSATSNRAPAGYVLRPPAGMTWSKLPVPAGIAGDHTTSIDGWGDVTGWLTTGRTGEPVQGAVWTRAGGGYRLTVLRPNHLFSRPVVNAADHFGDAIGSEMRGVGRTFAVVWAPWGKAYRLPGLSKAPADSVATGLLAQGGGVRRMLTIVGSSVDGTGTLQAVVWTVAVGSSTVRASRPVRLAGPASAVPSAAVAINRQGWVVGTLGSPGASSGIFLWRPGAGMVDVATLLPPSGGWVVRSVAGINGAGQIVGQGYGSRLGQPSSPRAVILTPHTVAPGPSRSPV